MVRSAPAPNHNTHCQYIGNDEDERKFSSKRVRWILVVPRFFLHGNLKFLIQNFANVFVVHYMKDCICSRRYCYHTLPTTMHAKYTKDDGMLGLTV